MKRKMICILCPRGCELETEKTEEGIMVEGNFCPRGEKYAVEELTHPLRCVTAVVRVGNRTNSVVSVKTENPIPKEKVLELAHVLKGTKAVAPIRFGDVILKDVYGTDVVATGEIR